jgi:lambda family phage holin
MFEEGKGFGELLKENPWVGGLMMAVTMSAMRMIYDKKETHIARILLESLICGALTIAAGSALIAMGYGQGWYLFCGGTIGFMGSQSVRALAQKLINRKAGD